MDRPEPGGLSQAAQDPAHRSPTSPTPTDVAAVIAAAKGQEMDLLALYMRLAAVTGARRGELCGLQWADIDLDARLVHIAFSYLVRDGQKIRKDTKTHQDRHLAIDAVTVAVLAERKQQVQVLLATTNVVLGSTAYVFASDPLGLTPWNPDWVTHKVAEVAVALGSASTSRPCATTPQASCWPAGSTCVTQPPPRPRRRRRRRSATTPTRSLRWTAVRLPISLN
jgi:integrase